MARYEIDEVRKIFKDGGCELLEDVYINNQTPMKYKCECGRYSTISLSSFKRGSRCIECGKEKGRKKRIKYTIDTVRAIFEEKECILLEDSYHGYHIPMDFICSCGNKSQIRLADFLRGQRCQKCKGEKLREHFSFDYEDVFTFFQSQGCLLLTDKYINSDQKLDYICSCGKKSTITYKKFRYGQRCKDCGTEKYSNALKLEYNFVKKCFEDRGCVLLSTDYVNSKSKLDYICHCGNKHSISFSNFHYHNQDCDKCMITKRSGENHPNWNPNLTQEERENQRHYPEYHEWVDDVYRRDDYTCQCCGDRGGRLNAHHIYNYSQYKELRVNLDNGITLCETCHKDFHNFYGYQDNDEYQLREYIDEIHDEIFSLST